MASDPSELRAAIDAVPGMDRILAAVEALAPTYLVGGAVRDLLRVGAVGDLPRGRPAYDLDIAVEGPAEAAAQELAERLGGEVVEHERFGTASVRAGEIALDLASSRRERYPRPGALPEVEPAPIEQDLGRRDFTVNAMATPLRGEGRGRLIDPHGGRGDLDDGLIRVLHGRSFVDDPTRLLRAIRYEARLGFAIEPGTEALARAAIADRVSDTVSGTRIGTELLYLLGEQSVREALARLAALGLDRVLDPALEVDPDLAARAAAAAGEGTGAEPSLAGLAALVAPAPDALARWLEGLGLSGSDRERVARAARSGPALAAELTAGPTAPAASAIHDLLAPEPPEALALALAFGAPPEPIHRYAGTLQGVRLDIGGDDLVAAGVPPSPALGRALAETLRHKLDGTVAGRDEELALALALARGEEAPR